MPKPGRNDSQSFHNKDLVLGVGVSVDRRRWDESRYEAFVDQLCGTREYQKEAIWTALRYLLGGEYTDARHLARINFEANDLIRERYGSFEGMERSLQFPNQLSASVDLATGTGKSYVLYGIATIMLAEGAIDRVLLLCPSTTIEAGLMEKFELLAGDSDLRDMLPEDAVIATPRIINASESIVTGSICIENYHAILEHVRSSIRDSLKGNGSRTLVLNDEAHHVANEAAGQIRRWKEFLTSPDYGFRYILGVSGTCYVGNDYFADVIYRYSLREAMEQRFVKKVHYVAEMPQTSRPEERWQLVYNRHNEIKRKLTARKIKPITIVVTSGIERCKDVSEELKAFLMEQMGKPRDYVDERVLVVHSAAPDLVRLPSVNSASSKVEWILSVSMLNEGWDVNRVFQIVPHEERAFNSKLLIAQVLGRGLRIPPTWGAGEQPVVTVFNHDAWAPRIKHLVDEVMEFEKRIPTFPLLLSEYNFDLLNIEYNPEPYVETHTKVGPYTIFAKGYIDLATEKAVEEVSVEFAEADTNTRTRWQTTIRHKTFTPQEVAAVMRQRLEDVPDEKDRAHYLQQFSVSRLEEIVRESVKKAGVRAITDGMRQKFLQALGTLQRKQAHIVRYKFEAKNYKPISTADRSLESVSASDLKHSKTLFYTPTTASTIPAEYKEFYDEAVEAGSGYKCVPVANNYDFRTSLNAVVADHENERRFVREIVDPQNAQHVTAWFKSTPIGFYEIDYAWKKGTVQKRGKFSPDFFIKTGDLMLVVEIKGQEEVSDPSEENRKKNQYATEHFRRLNDHQREIGDSMIYKFNFLTPGDYTNFFQSIRDGSIADFHSELDVELAEE